MLPPCVAFCIYASSLAFARNHFKDGYTRVALGSVRCEVFLDHCTQVRTACNPVRPAVRADGFQMPDQTIANSAEPICLRGIKVAADATKDGNNLFLPFENTLTQQPRCH